MATVSPSCSGAPRSACFPFTVAATAALARPRPIDVARSAAVAPSGRSRGDPSGRVTFMVRRGYRRGGGPPHRERGRGPPRRGRPPPGTRGGAGRAPPNRVSGAGARGPALTTAMTWSAAVRATGADLGGLIVTWPLANRYPITTSPQARPAATTAP